MTQLSNNQSFSFYPFLWTTEGKDINNNSRRAISIEEIYRLNMETRKKLGLDN
jgi:hypothetical protein